MTSSGQDDGVLQTGSGADSSRPVLILGAGINGCAVARELALNGVPVWLVDSGDIARGATSRSSRLIHGGLRYLEYRDVALVRESLRERERLLQLAPQFVTPLRLAIPVSSWLGGLVTAACRFTGLARVGVSFGKPGRRGLIAVRSGLTLYDWLAGRSSLRKHRVSVLKSGAEAESQSTPQVDRRTFRWVCEYSDAQMLYPERFVLALLADAKQAANEAGSSFEIRTWSRVSRNGNRFQIARDSETGGESEVLSVEPALVVNATGAWGDLTLESLDVKEPRLFAGTKGSHLYSRHAGLREALCGAGIYAEAADGRLVFILPCGEGTLIGTTDLPFEQSPEEAVADEDEVAYLVAMVNSVFESVELTAADVEMRHAGVRPLPRVDAARTAAIPRGHSIHISMQDAVEVLTLIGGKLTTCRTLAEEVADRVLEATGRTRVAGTASRVVPGGEDWPGSAELIDTRIRDLGDRYGLSVAQTNAVWTLIGNRFEDVFSPTDSEPDRRSLSGTEIPLEFVRWSIRNEEGRTLEDVVERRLMLTFSAGLTRSTLRELAEELVDAGRLAADEVESAIDGASIRMRHYYGKLVN